MHKLIGLLLLVGAVGCTKGGGGGNKPANNFDGTYVFDFHGVFTPDVGDPEEFDAYCYSDFVEQNGVSAMFVGLAAAGGPITDSVPLQAEATYPLFPQWALAVQFNGEGVVEVADPYDGSLFYDIKITDQTKAVMQAYTVSYEFSNMSALKDYEPYECTTGPGGVANRTAPERINLTNHTLRMVEEDFARKHPDLAPKRP